MDLRRLLEQLRRKLVQIIAPIEPGARTLALLEYRVEAVLLQDIDGGSRARDQAVVDAGAQPDEFCTWETASSCRLRFQAGSPYPRAFKTLGRAPGNAISYFFHYS